MQNKKIKKEIIDRLKRQCVVCGKKMKVILYKDRACRGGHYFGKMPLFHKRDLAEALKFGTRTSKVGNFEMQVLKKDPKPYKHVEYWECPKCYWRE